MDEISKCEKKLEKKRYRFFSRRKKNKINEMNEIPEIYDLKELLEHKNINLKPRVNHTKASKLCPSLLDILKKSVALGYFLEYLKVQDKKNLLDFWLEAETFRMITEKKYRRKAMLRENQRTRPGKEISNSITSPRKQHNTDLNIDCKCETEYGCNQIGNRKEKNVFIQPDDSSIDSINQSINSYEKSNSSLNSSLNKSFELTLNDMSPVSSAKSSGSSPSIASKEYRQRARTRSFIVDAVTIYTKYISLNADFPISLPSHERQNIEGVICKDKNYLDPNCFVNAQENVFQSLGRLHEEFLLTTNMIAYQLKEIQSSTLKLQDILYHEAILFYFTEFLDQQNCKAALEFYISTENFEEDIESKIISEVYVFEQVVGDAMHIYERYFSMKCPRQLIADDKLRIVLENNICREDGPQPNCFCIPMAYAWTVLSEVYLPAFLSSSLFQSYVAHLKSTSTYLDDAKSCSSSSVQSHDDFPLLSRVDSKSCILEDENNLEEFWFKPVHHQSTNRLSLGHVNEFGVFNSDMEPHPFNSQDTDFSVSKLGRAMKNLIRGETQQETEQLAWERARKIISDIQTQTQS